MNKIKRFIECLLPVTACNLKCPYCYIIQREKRNLEIPKLKYSPEIIGQALRKERFGGVCYFSICGAGETLIPDYTIDIVKEILKQGHFVNITTNGTLNNRFDEIIKLDKDLRKKLNISFSLHYLELIRLNKLEDFFKNVKKVHDNGISFVLQLNLCDEYIPYIDENKKICMKNVGALPQVAATRKEEDNLNKIDLLTNLSREEYIKEGEKFESPLFDFTMKNFNVKRKEFCYAGDWTCTLNLQTGKLNKCYASPLGQYIFDDIDKPIKFEAIGKNCNSKFCFNSSHFMSFGVIPEIDTPTYEQIRNRKEANWYISDEIKEAFNSKLNESNKEYNKFKKLKVNIKNRTLVILAKIKRNIWR